MTNATRPVVTIRPVGRWERLDLREIWTTRDLLLQLVKADISARHRQTVVGITWAFLVPIAAMVVFSLIFGHLGKFPSEGVPYPIFFFSGYIVWQFFQRALVNSVQGFVGNPALITKVYCPRFHLLVASIGTAAVDAMFAAFVLFLLYLYYGVVPQWPILLLPFFLLLGLACAVSFALWLGPLNVEFRDIQMALPSVLQFWFFLSPVVYPVSFLPEWLRVLTYLNPMTTVLEGTRWALVGAPPPQIVGVAVSVAVISIVLVPGVLFFAAKARTLADRI